MSKKNQLAVTEEHMTVTIDLTDVRGVLEKIFNNNPDAREDVNKAWAMVQAMGNQMESLAKTVGSLNRLVVMLKEQRDELVAQNAVAWDEGYTAGEKVGAFMQNHEALTMDTIQAIIEENIQDGHFVYADGDDIKLFCQALMSGEFQMDEGETLSDLVTAVANRMREQVDFELDEVSDES